MRISDWSSDVCSSDLRSFFERQSASSFIYRNCQSNLVDISEFDFLPRVAISVPKANFRFLWNGWPGARQPAGRRRSLKDKVGQSVADEKQGSKARQRSRSEEHTSELQSLMRISYAVFCLKKKNKKVNSKATQHYKRHRTCKITIYHKRTSQS